MYQSDRCSFCTILKLILLKFSQPSQAWQPSRYVYLHQVHVFYFFPITISHLTTTKCSVLGTFLQIQRKLKYNFQIGENLSSWGMLNLKRRMAVLSLLVKTKIDRSYEPLSPSSWIGQCSDWTPMSLHWPHVEPNKFLRFWGVRGTFSKPRSAGGAINKGSTGYSIMEGWQSTLWYPDGWLTRFCPTCI